MALWRFRWKEGLCCGPLWTFILYVEAHQNVPGTRLAQSQILAVLACKRGLQEGTRGMSTTPWLNHA